MCHSCPDAEMGGGVGGGDVQQPKKKDVRGLNTAEQEEDYFTNSIHHGCLPP